MPSMADRRKATDKRIYQAAVIEFGNRGYANTTLSAIAKAAGITPGLIVQNFGSKEDLYRKIANDIVNFITTEFNKYSTSWEERCTAVVNYIIKNLEERPEALDYMNFYVTLITSMDTPDDIIQSLYDLYYNSPIETVVLQGQAKGELIDGDPYAIHGLFWLIMFNTIRTCFKNGLDYPPIDWFLDIIRKH